uniref:Mitochondrial import receptor subunit TOM7 homolog n=1 Tax=Glossina austeni TaxID=7395 RepID=A0A1A9VND1_GLOAU
MYISTMAMSPDVKERLEIVYYVAKTTFHGGFIPLVLYLGFRKEAEPGMPPLSILSLCYGNEKYLDFIDFMATLSQCCNRSDKPYLPRMSKIIVSLEYRITY